MKLSACLILCAASAGAIAAPNSSCTSIRPSVCPAHTDGFGDEDWLTRKVTAGDGIAGDVFGFSAAMQGSVAMIGAVQGNAAPTGTSNGGFGRVYVYQRAGSEWSVVQKLAADDGAADDQFGYAVALDGDTAFISASFADVGTQTNQGAVYVFTHDQDGWTQTQKLTAPDGEAGDQYGWSVAVSGDHAIVGSRGATSSGNDAQGAAYVYVRKGGTWTQEARLSDSMGTNNDQFGYAVAIRGTTALVSAPNSSSASGSAVFFTEAGGTWTQGDTVSAVDGASNENFGFAVAFDGTTAVISAPFATVGANGFQGAAYAFGQSAGHWTQTQKIVANDGQFFDALGPSLALDGDNLLITAPFFNGSAGATYRYTRSGGMWTQVEKLVANDAVAGEGAAYGYVAAMSEGSFVVGQALAKIGSNAYQGGAYFYMPVPSEVIFANGFEAPAGR